MTTPADAPLLDPIRPNWVWQAFRLVFRNVVAFWMRYRARGIEKLPREGGALLLINHQSFLDPLLVGLPLQRPVSYLARDNLFRVPCIGWVLRHTYVMPIRREAATTQSLRESLRRLEHGFLVGLFPEGTRSRDGAVADLKPGFVALVRRSNTPVIPVGIAGAHRALPRGSLLLRPRRVHVVFGDPITRDELAPFLERGREQDLLAFAKERLVACQTEAEQWRCDQVTRARRALTTICCKSAASKSMSSVE